MLALDTLTSSYSKIPATVVGALIVALLPAVVVIVWFEPLLIVYVKVYGAAPLAPVKVNNGLVPFWQTAAVPEMVAVGNGFTVTVAVPLAELRQVVELASLTLTSV